MRARRLVGTAVVALATTAAIVLAPPAPAAPGDALPLGTLVGTPTPGSTPLTCVDAGTHHVLTADTHLDPACTWTGGFEIVEPGVTLDCRGALVDGGGKGPAAVVVHADVAVTLSDVTVRNCEVAGFLNGIKVTRDGFRALTPADGYDHTTERILIENVAAHDSRGVGIFVDGFVSDVTIRDVEVTRAGSSGIYLDTDSRRNEITRTHLHRNGHLENGPDGQIFTVGSLDAWWWGTGREGLSIDGSSENHVHDNVIESNVAGGIFVYKNCGEFWQSRPDRWWPRFSGSDDNVIEGNTIRDQEHGIWVGSRMAQNQYFMECSDPAYGEAPLVRYHEDAADRNQVLDNVFEDVRYGVRVEDDGTTVRGNTFRGGDVDSLAVVVGTKVRAELLGRPVVGTTVEGNVADLDGVDHPYRWIPTQVGTTYGVNRSHGRIVGWCEGAQPTIGPALFITSIEVPVPDPPVPPDPVPPVSQPPCPRGTDPTTSTTSTTAAPTTTVPPGAAVPVPATPSFTG